MIVAVDVVILNVLVVYCAFSTARETPSQTCMPWPALSIEVQGPA